MWRDAIFQNGKNRGPPLLDFYCQSEMTDPAVDAAGLFDTISLSTELGRKASYPR
jgi:hypothetical protein